MVKKILLFSFLSLNSALFSSSNPTGSKLFKKYQALILTIHSKSTEEKGQVLDIVTSLKEVDKEKLNKLAEEAPVAKMVFEASLDDTEKAIEAIMKGEAPSKDSETSRRFKGYDPEKQAYILKGNNIMNFILHGLNGVKTIEKDENKIAQTAICCANSYLTLNNQATYGYVLKIT